MSRSNRRIIYVTARGTVIYRELENVSETEHHIQASDGFYLITYRKDRILEDVDDETNIPKRMAHWHEEVGRKGGGGRIIRPSIPGVMEVCFTGFKSADKKRLIGLAEDAGLMVRKAVTSRLDVLCCGPNAGPAKLERARDQGCLILTEDEFLVFKDTGEVPLDA